MSSGGRQVAKLADFGYGSDLVKVTKNAINCGIFVPIFIDFVFTFFLAVVRYCRRFVLKLECLL